MSDATTSNIYVVWLGCLNILLQKIKKNGLLAIEIEAEIPADPRSTFARFPETLQSPYIDFASDVLKIKANGYGDVEELQLYADHYIAGLVAQNVATPNSPVDENLLRAIWLVFRSYLKDFQPHLACEFGRQAIPAHSKPTSSELKVFLIQLEAKLRYRTKEELNQDIDDFIASLN